MQQVAQELGVMASQLKAFHLLAPKLTPFNLA